jgi:hypothetical protein
VEPFRLQCPYRGGRPLQKDTPARRPSLPTGSRLHESSPKPAWPSHPGLQYTETANSRWIRKWMQPAFLQSFFGKLVRRSWTTKSAPRKVSL